MGDSSKLLQVGELADMGGKTVRAIHHYEEMGLIRPVARSKGGYRLFSRETLDRIRWVGMLQELGFTLSEVRDWLRNLEDKTAAPAAMLEVQVLFQEKLAETRRSIERLRILEQELISSLEYLKTCKHCHHEEKITICCACDQPHTDARPPQLIAGLHGG